MFSATQENLPFKWAIAPPVDVYPLYAPTSPNGFFALSNLNDFCRGQIDPLLGIRSGTTFIFDFSRVKVWDISALLWLSIALQFYRTSKLLFRLKLPDVNEKAKDKENIEFQRSADFLRRWRFDRALAHVGDLNSLLLPEQIDFFKTGPKKFYSDDHVTEDPEGLLNKLLTNRLVEIRDITRDNTIRRQSEISDDEIDNCLRDFQDAKIDNILINNCHIEKNHAACFAEHLIHESLLNIKQHPNATTGMLSVAVLGQSRELILSVVDNGESIARTILDVYNKNYRTRFNKHFLSRVSLMNRKAIIHYATQPYVSSKPMDTDEEIGLGLTYIKEDTINKFKGRLRIISESVQVTYSHDTKAEPELREWRHKWNGNLLRISIPLKKGRQ